MPYEVETPVFAGPFDLLLHLILKQEVDLWEVSLDAVRESGLVVEGDRVVITAGTAVNIPGSTNVIKVEVA